MAKGSSAVQDEADKLFAEAGVDDAGNDVGVDDFDDLLDSVEEDDSEGWVPTEKGEGIAGVLLKIGETRSDFADKDEDAMCPVWTIQTGDGTKYRVIGYGAVLKREMNDSPAQVGWRVAVKYFGEKPIKKGRFQGKPYKHFGIAARPPVAVSS